MLKLFDSFYQQLILLTAMLRDQFKGHLVKERVLEENSHTYTQYILVIGNKSVLKLLVSEHRQSVVVNNTLSNKQQKLLHIVHKVTDIPLHSFTPIFLLNIDDK